MDLSTGACGGAGGPGPGELFLKKVAIRHPGAAPGRPRAQKNTPPPLTPPENNILAAHMSRAYERTRKKSRSAQPGRQQTGRTRAISALRELKSGASARQRVR